MGVNSIKDLLFSLMQCSQIHRMIYWDIALQLHAITSCWYETFNMKDHSTKEIQGWQVPLIILNSTFSLVVDFGSFGVKKNLSTLWKKNKTTVNEKPHYKIH